MSTDEPKNKARSRPAHFPVMARGNQSILIFVTVCSKDRKRIFNQPRVHETICAAWSHAMDWLVGKYVLMPDHIHFFCAPGRFNYPALKSWMKYWKTLASRSWPFPDQQPIWQVDCWDTQLRRGDSYKAKWDYVRHNPVRAGLVETPEAWVFQGEMNALMWHEG